MDGRRSAILKRYHGVYAALSAAQRCRKSQLAAAELRAVGIPTPAVLAAAPEAAAVLIEDVGTWSWSDGARSDAAAALRRLHEVDSAALSVELRSLVAATEPNRARIALGVEMLVAELDEADPAWRERAADLAAEVEALLAVGEPRPTPDECTLVHGDYFRANLVASPDGVQVIDWDRFAVGDPAWDIGFVIGAEPGIPDAATESARTAYGRLAPGVEQRLIWHARCWKSFWALRALLP